MILIVNVSNISNDINVIKKVRDEYDENNLNYYNQVNDLRNFWTVNKANYFFQNIDDEEKNVSKIVNDLDLVINLLDVVREKFQNIGDEIEFDLSNRKVVLKKVDECVVKIKKIVSLYTKYINDDNYREFKTILVEHRTKFKNNLEIFLSVYDDIENSLENIEQIENKFRDDLKKVDISVVNESDISRCM